MSKGNTSKGKTMSEINRRDVLLGISALAAFGGQASAQATDKAAGDFAAGPRVFALSSITPTKTANGGQRIVAFNGTLATGEMLAAHESWTPAGLPPAPTHTITHSELIVVLEGNLTFVHGDKQEPAAAGDVIYVAYGTNHAIRNTGATTARYLVLQVGGDTK
jgi:mannose-6-phosphate isomerase-like protein (cupin superfamily)